MRGSRLCSGGQIPEIPVLRVPGALFDDPGEVVGGYLVLEHLGHNEQLLPGQVGDVSRALGKVEDRGYRPLCTDMENGPLDPISNKEAALPIQLHSIQIADRCGRYRRHLASA